MRLALIVTVLVLAAPAVAQAAAPAPVTWCGTDEVTQNRLPDLDVSAPQQVRFVYAVPSDAPDNFASVASGIATDAAWIDSWWQAQDPTRAPRFDRYPFPGCTSPFGQLDIGFVRLASPSILYSITQNPSGRLDRDFEQLFPAKQKTIVYFDAPVRDGQVCGVTDYLADSEGGARGIVYIFMQSGCDTGPPGAGGTAQVAAHELLHNLGAVPDEAPHACHNANGNHICPEGSTDIMDPFLDTGSTLDSVQLDPGHDDYYAHAGAWWDIQDSSWLAHLPQFPFSASVAGNGTLVTRAGGGPRIAACNQGCASLPLDNGAQVSLTAVPAAGYAFARWSGACRGAAPSCTVAVGGPTAVTASFVKAALRVTVAVSGSGRVSSAPAGIACSRACTKVFAATSVKLVARPAPGSRFAGWSGACKGKRTACTVTKPGTARATFTRR